VYLALPLRGSSWHWIMSLRLKGPNDRARACENVWWYLQLFEYNARARQTHKRTDRRRDIGRQLVRRFRIASCGKNWSCEAQTDRQKQCSNYRREWWRYLGTGLCHPRHRPGWMNPADITFFWLCFLFTMLYRVSQRSPDASALLTILTPENMSSDNRLSIHTRILAWYNTINYPIPINPCKIFAGWAGS